MTKTKSELRRQLKQARLALSGEERQAKSAAIVSQLWQTLDWSQLQMQVKNLHVYEPIERLGEVDITDLVTALQIDYPDIRLFTSRQVNHSWQIVSIKDGKLVSESEFDIIIVPMLGFDDNLHRIGYGGGYYDRFLATQPRAQKIGVCFEQGHLNHAIPAEPHDIPMNIIITETTP